MLIRNSTVIFLGVFMMLIVNTECSFDPLALIGKVKSYIKQITGWGTTKKVSDYINPLDQDALLETLETTTMAPTTNSGSSEDSDEERILLKGSNKIADNIYYFNYSDNTDIPETDCFGLGNTMKKIRWFLDLKPQQSHEVNVEYYFSNRGQYGRFQVYPDDQFGLEYTKFDPKKPTYVIVHGFLSYSNASWVRNMTKALLDRDDVNVITVDWSKGCNSWRYWRAVANTRTVGTDLASFLKTVIEETKADVKKFHFIGHSLGAHICSFASNKIGRVGRITGLDPAQPCFVTTDLDNLLDKSDADFVDVIHTNGRKLSKIGLGVPKACGHQDFYPNGGMKQPGCEPEQLSLFSRISPISQQKISRAICNHGRAHRLFTESLKNHSCTLIGHKWNLSYNSINSSLDTPCTEDNCSELGINAIKSKAQGSFYVLTSSRMPFCVRTHFNNIETRHKLISDLKAYESTEVPDVSSVAPVKKSGWFSGWFSKSTKN